MIRSPRRHEGPPRRPEQTIIATTSLAFGAEKGGYAIRHNTSLRKPRVNGNFQRTHVSKKKKPMTEASARLQLLPTKSPGGAAALSSSGNWKHSSTSAFGPLTRIPKWVRAVGCGILNITSHRPQQNQAKLWGCGHTGRQILRTG